MQNAKTQNYMTPRLILIVNALSLSMRSCTTVTQEVTGSKTVSGELSFVYSQHDAD